MQITESNNRDKCVEIETVQRLGMDRKVCGLIMKKTSLHEWESIK